jgi:HK97 family phage major capsid protein
VSEDTISKFDQAASLRTVAEKALADGDLEQASRLADEMEAIQSEAEKESALQERLEKSLTRDMQPINSLPVASEDVRLDAKNYQRADGTYQSHVDANYRPAGWVKSDNGRDMPAMAQPSWILDKAGDNVKAEAAFQSDTWLRWFTSKSEENFFRTASPDEKKAMEEGVDTEGGYFVPEEFINQTYTIPDSPGGQLRDHCTVIRVTSKDGFVPTLGSTTFTGLDEEAAFTGVETTPTVGQVAFATGKYASLIRVSDEQPDPSNALKACKQKLPSVLWGTRTDGSLHGGEDVKGRVPRVPRRRRWRDILSRRVLRCTCQGLKGPR